MSGETELQVSGWTVDTLKFHIEALAIEKRRTEEERDRRYTEVNIEREKALKIKETADRDALGLAREIQTYKDEKANELREQIGSERGIYVTRSELKPIADYVQSQQGRAQGIDNFSKFLIAVAGVIVAMAGIYFGTH